MLEHESSLELPGGELTDGVISLRHWHEGDAADIVQVTSDPAVSRWLPGTPHPYTREHARSFILRATKELEERTAAHMAIRDAATDEALGVIAVYDLDWTDRTGKVGYWVAAAARGRGAATRGLRLVVEWSFRDLELQRLELTCDPHNIASLKVVTRAGFVKEGLRRSCYETLDGRRDLALYGLLPTDPLPWLEKPDIPDTPRTGRGQAADTP